MKIVVIGARPISSKLVTRLGQHGHQAVAAPPAPGPASPPAGQLAGALAGAAVVIDVASPSPAEAAAALDFFPASTRNLLAAEAAARVRASRGPVGGGDRAAAAQRLLPGQERPGGADRELGDPVFDCAGDAVFRVLAEHRGRGHRRQRRPAGTGAVPADRRGRCRPGDRQDGSRAAAARPSRGRRARAVPARRLLPARPGQVGRSAHGGHRPSCGLLRHRTGRADPAAGRGRIRRRDPLPRLAGRPGWRQRLPAGARARRQDRADPGRNQPGRRGSRRHADRGVAVRSGR